MTYDFTQSTILPASPQRVYDAWMSGEQHSAMTGGEATVDPRVGGAFTAWDGYITGRNLELDPGKRILQSWRTDEFADDDPDSTIEVLLEPVPEGTLLTLKHLGVPSGQHQYEDGGWQSQYFEPMAEYFAAEE